MIRRNLLINPNLAGNELGAMHTGILVSVPEPNIRRVELEPTHGNWWEFSFIRRKPTIEVGKDYIFSFDMRTTNGNGVPTLYLGDSAGMNSYRRVIGAPTEDWSRLYLAYNAVTSTSIRPHFGFGGLNGTYDFRHFMLEEGTVLNDFFYGDTPPQDSHTFAWEGTPNNSVSIMAPGKTTNILTENGWEEKPVKRLLDGEWVATRDR